MEFTIPTAPISQFSQTREENIPRKITETCNKDTILKIMRKPVQFLKNHPVRRPAAIFILLLFSLLLQPLLSFAQSISSPWQPYRREDGLASNNVLAILPGDGEMWFGTDTGISRFNGEWETFRPTTDEVNALAHGAIAGQLWAGTDEGNVLFWDGSTWANLAQVTGAIHALLNVGGDLWIGSDSGLLIWADSDFVEVDFPKDVRVQALASQGNAIWVGTVNGLWVHQRDSWSEITTNGALSWGNVSAIWADPNGGPVWVAAENRLAWREPANGSWTYIDTESLQATAQNPIVALAGDANGFVWGGTRGSGGFVVKTGHAPIAFSGEGEGTLATPFVQSVAVDRDGLVWFGTQSGISRYDETMWIKEFGDNINYPGINSIIAIESSAADELWLASATGGIRVKRFQNGSTTEEVYTTSQGDLPTNYISGLTRDFEGNIWAGTHIGIARYNRETNAWDKPFPTADLPSELVTTLLANDTSLWIGTGSGLVQYDLIDQTSTVALENIHVKVLAVDSLRRLWVGTLSDGLFIHQLDGTWEQHTSQSSSGETTILDGPVVALAADPNTSGGVWVGVDQAGINYWNGTMWEDLTEEAILPSKLLYQFYTDPVNGSLWIGTEGGISRYDGRSWGTLVVEAALPRGAILSISRSGDSYWFGGRDGLTFYHPERTKPWVRFVRVDGKRVADYLGNIPVETGREIFIDYQAGDLYTQQQDMAILVRITGPGQIGAWETVQDKLILNDLSEGITNIELQARDQAFNYSDTVRLNLNAVTAPMMIDLPVLGRMRLDYFSALVILGLLSVSGAGYIFTEISRNRKRTREAISRGFNPFVSGEPIRGEDMFFGRHDLLQRIIDTLHNNSIMIHGERRIGKTTLLHQLTARLREIDDPNFWFIPLYVDVEGTTEQGFFHLLMDEILDGVIKLPAAEEEIRPHLADLHYYKTPESDYTDREFSRDLRVLVEQLRLYSARRHPLKQLRIILLMDEMDVMSNFSRIVQQQMRRIFMREFAATLGAVVAGIQISKEWDRVESPWYNLFNEIELQPFTREQAIELLTEPIRGYYEYEPAALEHVIEESGGKPYRLQQYAMEAVNRMLSDGRRQIRLDDVEHAHQHLEPMDDHQVGIDIANGQNGVKNKKAESADSEAASTDENQQESRVD